MEPEKIKKIVSDHFNLSVAIMDGKCRKREYVEPRHLAMALVKEYTILPLTAIGRIFKRDHSTVIHAISVVKSLLCQRKYKEIWSALKHKIDLSKEDEYEWERAS